MKTRSFMLCLAIVCLLPPGCVRRRLTIRSNPPGATVYIDDQEVGETPVSTSYVYYGTREIQLVKDGYETLTVKEKFSPPWYQVAPIDFFTENLVPYEFRDERISDFELEPQRVVPVTELMDRAQQLRNSTQAGYAVPVPPTVTQPRDAGRTQDTYLPPAFPPEQ